MYKKRKFFLHVCTAKKITSTVLNLLLFIFCILLNFIVSKNAATI